MKHFAIKIGIILASSVCLAVALLWALGTASPVHADPGMRYVAPDGDDAKDCSDYANRCRTIQRAVDTAAPGDEVLVATGTYTDVHQRLGITQTVYISKSISILGGYSSDFSARDPAIHPTTLDARGLGRVIYARGEISAYITVTLEGLRLTRGSISGGRGGGIHVEWASPIISGCHAYSNTATWGGGIWLENTPDAVLRGNRVTSNTASISGGGVHLANSSEATLTDNQVYANSSGGMGGGLTADSSHDVTLTGNEVTSNTAATGGGINFSTSHNGTLDGNTVCLNTATIGLGGGIRFDASNDATLVGNTVCSNTAETDGGGIYVAADAAVTLTGNTVTSNTAKRDGGGIYLAIGAGTPRLTDETVAGNAAAQYGGGVYLVGGQTPLFSGNHIFNNTSSTGGGVYLRTDQFTLASSWIYSNTAQTGGGAYLSSCSHATLSGNHVTSNTAQGDGGGVHIHNSNDVTLWNNDVTSNTAAKYGGICLYGSVDVRIESNRVTGNTATTQHGGGIGVVANSHNAILENNDVTSNTAKLGGGIYVQDSLTATLRTNRISGNTGDMGGGGIELASAHNALLKGNEVHHNTAEGRSGISIYTSHRVTLESNHIHDNTTVDYSGGGIGIDLSDDATLVNNLVVENRAVGSALAPGIFILRSSNARLLHTTVARNSGGDGSGISIGGVVEVHAAAALTNTILVSQTVGIAVGTGCTATLEATLWGEGEWANGDEWAVEDSGQVFTSTDVYGPPEFLDPDGGDYHISSGSAAHEAGVSTDVTDDIDGDPRPFGLPDLGADEISCHVRLNGTSYDRVQAAVDASTSAADVVQVAGTCRGVEARGPYDQVVYISKTLTVRGGYSADFLSWDPPAYPTTLDAEEQGHVVVIQGSMPGSITPTLEALRVTNGKDSQGGAGIYSWFADTVISGCQIYSNTATQNPGGGIYIANSPNVRLTNNRIYDNAALWPTSSKGGGIYVGGCDGAILAGNVITDNTAPQGGGLYLFDSDATLINNIIAGNEASSKGSGLHLLNSSPHLLHTTIARNTGGDGSGIHIARSGGSSHSIAVLTNTILVGHEVGITVAAGCTATLEGTLWGSGDWANDAPWAGPGAVATGADVYGNPRFVAPDDGDYHICLGSAAANAGVPAGVEADIDGDPRPTNQPDLGADEVENAIYLPLVLRNY